MERACYLENQYGISKEEYFLLFESEIESVYLVDAKDSYHITTVGEVMGEVMLNKEHIIAISDNPFENIVNIIEVVGKRLESMNLSTLEEFEKAKQRISELTLPSRKLSSFAF